MTIPWRGGLRGLAGLVVLAAGLTVSASATFAQTAREAARYVLALSWQPTFCASRDGARAVECRESVAPHLALHGLWPQAGEYCAAEGRDLRRVRWRDLPPVRVSAALRQALDSAMPGTRSHLDRYQWAKHGTCSGLDQERYFRAAVDLHDQAMKTGFTGFIRRNAGGDIRVADLCAALGRDLGADFDRAVRIVQERTQDGRFLLAEIRIAMTAGADGRLDLASRRLAPLDRGDGFRCGNARPEWRLRLAPD